MIVTSGVRTTLTDGHTGVTYHIVAERSLTIAEAFESIAQHHATTERAPDPPGTLVTIVTQIGCSP